MTATPITLEDLRTVDLFDELGDDQLGEWVAVARESLVEPGDVVSEQGEEVEALMLLLDGTVQTFLLDGGRAEPVGRQLAPTWMGAIGILTGGPLRVRMQAETACRLALIEADDVRRLAFSQPVVHQRVMSRVTPVMTRVAGIEQNRERLASLGTMAAGLAHELNNPASAAQRTAEQMAEALDVVSSTLGRFVEAGISREDAEQLVAVQREALASAGSRTALDALDAADAEDELLARLEELGVPEPWRITDVLASAGVDRSWLDRVASLAGPATDAAVAWVAATLTARGLAAELQESTQRMSTLVAAVKSYAYMDRGELVEVDLHEGLETTITILGHKLKHAEIDVVRDYDRDLPKLTVRAPELNQVWTNLLDNAIDALGDSGTITITTRHDGNCAYVRVTDDGPGIAPENLDRVFDSFFTTKDVGSGTGLGLATARQIVADRHDGSLTVDSEPGRTTFQVSLPITKP
jgi:signal transduction histidine kinase